MSNIRIKKDPIPQQQVIIDYDGNLAVLAKPGSGKTFTIAEKIKKILSKSIDFKGVIAISFTNKASKELKNRVLNGGVDKKGSFFNTMTTFYLMEIIYPFGSHLFGKDTLDFKVFGANETDEEVQLYRTNNDGIDYNHLTNEKYLELGRLYKSGKILIESIDTLAVFIFDNSYACRRYLKSRYTHVFIDEYQDCGYMQNHLFNRLVNLGLIGVAVGDKDQSIYGFSGKSSDYLISLASNPNFKPFYLDKNFRCHKSISDYSLRLINSSYEVDATIEKRVVRAQIIGKEEEVANFIEASIPIIKQQYAIVNNNDFTILVKNNKTGEYISAFLTIGHKLFKKTDIDDDSSLWASVFKNLLICVQDESYGAYEFTEEYFDAISDEVNFRKLYKQIEKTRKDFHNQDTQQKIRSFIKIAEFIYPNARNESSISKINNVLSDKESLESFFPASNDQVQIMTLHKSKGLEFKVVFHLNLHKFILPEEFNGSYKDYEQCKNLHYVGITRAEELCILLTSTKRRNGVGVEKTGEPSEFFNTNDLMNYSTRWIDVFPNI